MLDKKDNITVYTALKKMLNVYYVKIERVKLSIPTEWTIPEMFFDNTFARFRERGEFFNRGAQFPLSSAQLGFQR